MLSLIDVLKRKRKDLYDRFHLLAIDASNTVLRELGKNDSVHSKAVMQLLDKLIPDEVLTNPDLLPPEGIYLLLVAVYLHDVGRSDPVGHHAINSYEMIKNDPNRFCLYEPFVPKAVAEICAAHAPEHIWPIDSCQKEYGIEGLCARPLNLSHLGALLRIADELDNTYLRVRGINSEKGSPREIIRFINPKPEVKQIEIQSEPMSKADFDHLQGICRYTNKILSEVRHKLAEMRIYYDQVVLTPESFIPTIGSLVEPSAQRSFQHTVDFARPIDVRLEYKQQKLDASVIRSVAFSPCGTFMAYSRDEKIEVVTLTPKGPEPFPESFARHLKDKHQENPSPDDGHIDHLYQNDAVTDICFSSDGRLLASSDCDGYINIWDFRLRKCVALLKAHMGEVTAISFSPKGDFLASGSLDEFIHIWRVAEAVNGASEPWKTFEKKSRIKKIAKYQHDIEEIQTIAFSHNGRHLAAGDQQGVVTVREIETGVEMYQSKVHNQHIVSVRFSPNNPSLLVTASDDTRIRLVDCNRKGISTLGTGEDKHSKALTSIALSSTGRLLISAAADGLIKIWDVFDQRLLHTYRGSEDGYKTNRLAFVPNRYCFASNSFLSAVNLWAITNKGDIQNAIITE